MTTTLDRLVTTSKLSKETSKVLRDAARHPVSVPRPGGGAITLVNRTDWHRGAVALEWVGKLATIVRYWLERMDGTQGATLPSDFGWLQVFSSDELGELTHECSEVLSARGTLDEDAWEALEAILYEWRESSLALSDQALQERLRGARKQIAK